MVRLKLSDKKNLISEASAREMLMCIKMSHDERIPGETNGVRNGNGNGHRHGHGGVGVGDQHR